MIVTCNKIGKEVHHDEAVFLSLEKNKKPFVGKFDLATRKEKGPCAQN